MVPNPTWLDAKFPQQAKQVKRPCVALVSTDKQWIVFMKLRLDRVMRFDLEGMPTEEVRPPPPLPAGPKPRSCTRLPPAARWSQRICCSSSSLCVWLRLC
jgi:hypothetical protein